MNDLDLDKIAEFMNSEPTSEVDSQEIETALDYIDTQLSTVKEQTKNVATIEDVKKQEVTIDDLTNIALKQVGKVDSNTDELYNLFYKPLLLGQDHSESSKVAIIDSQRLKVEMINAIAGLAQAKAKLEMAKAKLNSGNVGVFVGTQSGADVGISLHNLWENEKGE